MNNATVAKEPTPWFEIIILLATTFLLSWLFCGCSSARTSYTNGVIFWTSSTALGIGYGEYIEVAPGGKVHRKINGKKDTLELAIDNTAVKADEEPPK